MTGVVQRMDPLTNLQVLLLSDSDVCIDYVH